MGWRYNRKYWHSIAREEDWSTGIKASHNMIRYRIERELGCCWNKIRGIWPKCRVVYNLARKAGFTFPNIGTDMGWLV